MVAEKRKLLFSFLSDKCCGRSSAGLEVVGKLSSS